MVKGSQITAEIVAPESVEIPRRRRSVDVVVRISLHNAGEDDFIAHARSDDDSHFWHVLDEDHCEVMRHRRRKGADQVKVRKGVHSYRTQTVAGGQGVHGERTLTLEARRLEAGRIYTIRGQVYGHPAETTFVAVAEAPPKRKAKTARKKAAKPKKKAAKKRAAAKKKK